ncbi:MAG: transporter substrate-binding domain-containing protein [Solirubrobacterales bacterium]|nr:transporter substrate-binding domain-containing protein [Solirubrobacterales bacterium]
MRLRSCRPFSTSGVHRLPRLRLALLPLLAAVLALTVAACGSDEESSDESSPQTTASLDDCTPDQLETKSAGKLTVGTDKPAYPPYFEDNDPSNGEGFESAVAYAIAETLGYAPDDVEWTVVPFNASYAPGPKDFDLDLNQISITPKRAQQVDFSAPYYEAGQAVVALKSSDAAGATSLADLADTSIGVQIGTTSLDAVNASIQPSSEPQVFDTSNDVVSALKNGQIDAVVVDVPTAFYLTAAQVPEATVVGQFAAPGGDTWGALLEKGSALTPCISAAIDELDSSGELPSIEKQWMSEATKAPVLQ